MRKLSALLLVLFACNTSGDTEKIAAIRKQAEAGDLESQSLLGSHYYLDLADGVAAQKQAVKWLRKAAASGYLEACRALGESSLEGRGVPKDHKLAYKWFRQAAEQGDHQSQHRLGDQYRDGHGVAKDLVKAHAWYELSTRCYPKYLREKLGVRSPAEVDREVLAQKMTLEQTKKARKLAQILFKQIQANKETEPPPAP